MEAATVVRGGEVRARRYGSNGGVCGVVCGVEVVGREKNRIDPTIA